MFFDPTIKNTKLKYSPFKSCVIPRPIGWISSMSKEGVVNIAPYSYFNAVADSPPVIMFSSSLKEDGKVKDSVRNIEETGEFVVNMATLLNLEKMLLSSANLPHNHSEALEFGIELTGSNIVKVPRIKESPVALECKYIKKIDIEVADKKSGCQMILGHVVKIYIDDLFIKDGKIDVESIQPLARLGYDEYTVIKEIFRMKKLK